MGLTNGRIVLTAKGAGVEPGRRLQNLLEPSASFPPVGPAESGESPCGQRGAGGETGVEKGKNRGKKKAEAETTLRRRSGLRAHFHSSPQSSLSAKQALYEPHLLPSPQTTLSLQTSKEKQQWRQRETRPRSASTSARPIRASAFGYVSDSGGGKGGGERGRAEVKAGGRRKKRGETARERREERGTERGLRRKMGPFRILPSFPRPISVPPSPLPFFTS